jgi:hypothetical protein
MAFTHDPEYHSRERKIQGGVETGEDVTPGE